MANTRESTEIIVKAVPGFAPAWQDFLREWEKVNPPPLYLAMGELAHYIVDAYVRGNTAEFVELFAAIEVALQEENTELHILLSVGLFEDIQNISSHRTFDSKSFRHWLGRESLRAWDQVELACGKSRQGQQNEDHDGGSFGDGRNALVTKEHCRR
ncbi:MAG TPA: hypothetical protein VMH80_13170 [Bryobacteraceae bacterium]|nr:hypothetical protein [Bryobacteraceae bacterium]